MIALAILALVLAGFPALMYFRNVKLFTKPIAVESAERPSISVLIPARNEEAGIALALESILANAGVNLEVIVLDDHSTDRTAEIVRGFAPRVRLETAPPLPEGWCGKQFACYTLAGLASFEHLTFLDADVRLSPTALLRMHGFLQQSKAALVSGFPRQETGSFLEHLVAPLINWLLLCYLPIHLMRATASVGFGAGCGQWFTTSKTDYFRVGGHGHPWVKSSLHDGLKLPRAYRESGLMTDFCDATDEAACRMYRNAKQVWNGFAKNAGEGMGSPKAIGVWTVLLAGGHILPFALFLLLARNASILLIEPVVIALAVAFSWAPRFHAMVRFRQSLLGALLHPFGVAVILGIQWYALIRRVLGIPVGWKGRSKPA